MTIIDTAIIGAGPYGGSITAHLKAQGVSFDSSAAPCTFGVTRSSRHNDLG